MIKKDQEEWAALEEKAREYGSKTSIFSCRLHEREEYERLGDKLWSIRVDIASIGTTRQRAKVVRTYSNDGIPEVVLYDTGEMTAKSVENRLSRFLQEQIALEASLLTRR